MGVVIVALAEHKFIDAAPARTRKNARSRPFAEVTVDCASRALTYTPGLFRTSTQAFIRPFNPAA
jgi:hypothetical protein